MITPSEALHIHSLLIKAFGGVKGLRDQNALKSALDRPYQTFEGEELYQHPWSKAAAIIESIILNHPFVDGNKRIGYVLMRLTLLNYDFDIIATQEEKLVFVMNIAKGKLDFGEIEGWIDLKKKTRSNR